MSAIGDYVHLKAEDYNTYGIYLRRKSDTGKGIQSRGSATFNTSYNKQAIQSSIVKPSGLSVQEKEEIAKLLGEMINLNNISKGNKSKIYQVHAEIEELMRRDLEKNLLKIDWEQAKIVFENPDRARIPTIKKVKGTSKYSAQKITQAVAQLEGEIQRLQTIANSGSSNEANEAGVSATELRKALNNFKRLTKETYNLSWRELKSRGFKGELLNSAKSKEAEKKYISALNDIISIYAAYPPINLLNGELWEYIIAFLPYYAGILGFEELKKEMQKIKIGNDRVKGTMTLTAARLPNLNRSETYALDEDGNFVITLVSNAQGKIDVSFNWKGKELNISAKNINLKTSHGWVNTVSDSNLLAMVSNIDNNVVNHFLNIHSAHEDNVSIDSKNISTINKEIRKMIFIKSLQGGLYGQKAANLFIVRDNSKQGGINIMEVHEILTKLNTKTDKYSQHISVKMNNKPFHSNSTAVLFKNKKEIINQNEKITDALQRRISNILTEMEKIKISTSFRPSSFTK